MSPEAEAAKGADDQNKGGEGGSSMLDVEKIKAAKEGTQGEEQQGASDKVGADGKNADGSDKVQEGEKPTRPEWLAEKFWDAEKGAPRLEELNKGYQELEKKFRAGDHKAPDKPEGYKVALDEKSKALLFGSKDADVMKDPFYKQYAEWGVKHKVSQAAYDELLDLYAKGSVEETGKFQIDVSKEKASLGKNADAILENQHQFFEQAFKNGQIGEAELKEASILFETAAGIKLVQWMRSLSGEQPIPTDLPTDMAGVPSKEELGKMLYDPKYGVDKDFTAKVDGWYKKAYGNAPAMSSAQAR